MKKLIVAGVVAAVAAAVVYEIKERICDSKKCCKCREERDEYDDFYDELEEDLD